MDFENRPFIPVEEMPEDRKPRVALMGEFSAGKSTLSNLLIGGSALPTQVTATQLPPVWISGGAGLPYMVDVEDVRHEVDIENVDSIDVETTKYLRLFQDTDLLELCDLMDLPGISDPSMSSEVWERVLPFVDMVIWCSHATQAWRQSEAAVWSTVEEELKSKSILLLTRMDKITNQRDRDRVISRVQREAAGQFAGIFPISLLEAIEAGDDREKWNESGAEEFTMFLVDCLVRLQGDAAHERLQTAASRPPSEAGGGVQVRKKEAPARITPKRVMAKDGLNIQPGRPEPTDKDLALRLY